jgi:tetratricopeptide (TPR) repeat protein
VHAAVVRGLSTLASERFATMDELLSALERDPAARRRRLLTSLGAAALLLGGGAAIGVAASGGAPVESPSAVCTGASKEVASVWNDARRSAIADAFAATELGYAADTWKVAAARLDERTAAWALAHTRACEATRVTGEQSEAVMDLRIACLGEQRDRIDALLSGLQRVDGEGVRRAIDAVHALPDPELCTDPARLSADAPPTDPVTAEAVRAVDLALANVRAAQALGRFGEAAAALAPWIAVAEATEHLPLVARVRSLRAETEEATGDPKRARVILEEAMWAATAGGSDRLAADIARRLAFDVGYRLAEHDAGRRWLAHGRALERRLHGDEELAARLSGAEGAIEVSAGRYEDALVAHGRARAYWTAREDAKAELADVLLDIAAVHIQLGRIDEAIALGTEAVGIRRSVYGEDHPVLAAALRELGNAHAHAHAWDAALPLFSDALRIQSAARGEEHTAVATLHDDIGRVLRKKGDADAAIEHHRRALAIWIARLGENHQDVGVSRLNIGYTLSAVGRREDAVKEFAAALATFEAAVGERHAYVVYAENALAAALVQLGRPAEARPHLERVLALANLEVDPTLLSETEFTLANALWDDPASSSAERARARGLAEKALAGYRTQAERWAPQIEQIEGWLREHA